jgi:hypothetical protein
VIGLLPIWGVIKLTDMKYMYRALLLSLCLSIVIIAISFLDNSSKSNTLITAVIYYLLYFFWLQSILLGIYIYQEKILIEAKDISKALL